jgi:uncharacterized protein YecT (DUF1311 family)
MLRRIALVLPALGAGLLLATPAAAIDCRKAASAIEHMICADPQLERADSALGAAYASLLKSTSDPEIHTMLVAGQRRWLARRDEQLGDLDGTADPSPDAKAKRRILLDAMTDRTKYLARRSDRDHAVFALVETALDQRKFARSLTGGAFAGVETSCDFLPQAGHYTYGCFAERHYQNKDRVCSVREDWASGSVTETRYVGRIVDGKLQTVATCSIGGGDAGGLCPDPEDHSPMQGHWKSVTDEPAAPPPSPPLPKLDAELGPDPDDPWLHACLTDSSYP